MHGQQDIKICILIITQSVYKMCWRNSEF